jgi:dihydroorotate dehydrogenase (NAD+) catalytic subunit
MVYQVANAVKIPIIGMGGVMNAEDAIEFMMAGATGISVGTANFVNPMATIEIIDGMKRFMEQNKIQDINDIIGCVK